jgi:hypothetical protein
MSELLPRGGAVPVRAPAGDAAVHPRLWCGGAEDGSFTGEDVAAAVLGVEGVMQAPRNAGRLQKVLGKPVYMDELVEYLQRYKL